MNSSLNILFSILLSYISIYVLCKKFAGPYDIVFKSAYKCSDLGEDIFGYSTKLYKVNRTHNLYNSTVSCPRGINDVMSATVEVSVFSKDRWKDNFLNLNLDKACSDLVKLFPGLAESLIEAAGKEFSGCPIPPDEYHIKEWMFSINFAMAAFPYGTYKAVVTAWEHKTKLTCFTVEVDVMPKEQ